MSDHNAYLAQEEKIKSGAKTLADALIKPIMDQDSGLILESAKERKDKLKTALSGSIFESAGQNAAYVQSGAVNALTRYVNQHGAMPDAETLGAAACAIQNLYSDDIGKINNPMIAESVKGLSTTEGQVMRDHLALLVLPVQLNTITRAMVTTVPGNFDRAEVFRVMRTAGSTFGDLTKGDEIGEDFNGQYAAMDQIKPAAESADGTNKVFTLSVGMALKKGGISNGGYVQFLVDRDPVVKDDGHGNFVPCRNSGYTAAVSGIDYDAGVLSVELNKAPPNGVDVHFKYDVNIEKEPEHIPLVEHTAESDIVVPHESAISGVYTIQALYGLQREYNLDLNNMTLNSMRTILSADTDRKNLRTMWFAAKGLMTFDAKVPDGLPYLDHYRRIHEKLVQVDAYLLAVTKKAGLVGLVAKRGACTFLRSLGPEVFKEAPGYRAIPQPHYVGKLFGVYDVYCDPSPADISKGQTELDILCYSKGRDYGDAGMVANDVIQAVPFTLDSRAANLRQKNTLWSYGYRDIHPFNGRAYYTILRITR